MFRVETCINNKYDVSPPICPGTTVTNQDYDSEGSARRIQNMGLVGMVGIVAGGLPCSSPNNSQDSEASNLCFLARNAKHTPVPRIKRNADRTGSKKTPVSSVPLVPYSGSALQSCTQFKRRDNF